MDIALFIIELLVVLGCIVMGTRSSGVGLGLWGGAGVVILVFVFQISPGSPPIDALLIVLSVVLAASMMQSAGGIDWMVSVAAKLIAKNPKQITLVAPLVSFLFSVGAGTSNILYPLLPVIQDLSYRNGIRPSRPLSLSVVATGVALACSPVSAAMAAMVTLTDVSPWNFELIDILKVTIPAAIVGIVLSSIVVNRLGKDIANDPVPQPLRTLLSRMSRHMAAVQARAAQRAGAMVVSLRHSVGPVFRAAPREMFSIDQFHPSAKGYRRTADALLPAVLEAWYDATILFHSK